MDAPSILILDDGELADVAELLEQLGEPFVRLRGGTIPAHVEPPTRLLVATARRATLTSEALPGAGGMGGPRAIRIAVVDEDSNTLRSRLRRLGFDWLVRRPVHGQALRLLLARALYDGRERRHQDRLPVGTPVCVRTGLRRREAMLLDLSRGGCRLLMPQRVAPGSRVTIHVPDAAVTRRTMSLRARVVRCQAGGEEGCLLGVRFERISQDTRAHLQRLLEARAGGPAALPAPPRGRKAKGWRKALAGTPQATLRDPQTPAGAAGSAALRLEPSSPGERRKHARSAYRKVVSGLAEASHLALVGRDLSAGGMRIDPHPALREGDRLALDLYGGPDEGPLRVRGQVIRDAGRDGLAIAFDPLSGEIHQRIEGLVAGLPSVEALDTSETDALGSIVSHIVERETAEPEAEASAESDSDPEIAEGQGEPWLPDSDVSREPV